MRRAGNKQGNRGQHIESQALTKKISEIIYAVSYRKTELGMEALAIDITLNSIDL